MSDQAMRYFPYSFEDTIRLHGVGKARVITYKVLILPDELCNDLPFDRHPRLRVEGEIAEVPVRGAWMPVGDGRRYFIVSPRIKASTCLDVGDRVEMRFRVDDQDFVGVPAVLQAAIDADAETEVHWNGFTAGKKRMFAAHVASAKTADTATRRVAEAIDAIRHGQTLRERRRNQR